MITDDLKKTNMQVCQFIQDWKARVNNGSRCRFNSTNISVYTLKETYAKQVELYKCRRRDAWRICILKYINQPCIPI